MIRIGNSLFPHYPWKRLALYVAPLLATIAALFVLIGDETEIARYFAGVRMGHPGLTKMVDKFSDWGNVGYYVFYCLLLGYAVGACRRRPIHVIAGYLLTLALSLILVECVKSFVGRPRPDVVGDFSPFSSSNGFQSFPSGHVAETLLTVAPIALYFGRSFVPFIVGLSPVFMAVSRIYLGRHHPTDVLGSVVFGIAGALCIWFLARRMAFLRARLSGRFGRLELRLPGQRRAYKGRRSV